MTLDEAVDKVLAALAQVTGDSVEDLRGNLTEIGGDWPVDSIVLAESLVILEETLDFEIPMDKDTARALRSVRGLAGRMCDLELDLSAA